MPRFSFCFVLSIVLSPIRFDLCSAYALNPYSTACSKVTLRMSSGGKGFGKQDIPNISKKKDSSPSKPRNLESVIQPLESIGSAESATPRRVDIQLDPSLSPEERGNIILRERLGIKSFEERQAELKAAQYNEKLQKLNQRSEKNKDVDIFQLIPPPLLIFIDRFLKIGLAVSIFLFISGGIGITVEAWSHVSGDKLPEGIDKFIVEIIEPNFTPGLLVLLGFSISLGLFSAAQLGSESSKYTEK